MDTHIEARPARGGFDFSDAETRTPASRVLAVCGVTCDRAQIADIDPSCSWCARKQAERDEARRLERIGKATP